MKPISILFIPLALFFILFAAVLFKRNKISFQSFAVGFMIWGPIALAFIFPKTINAISKIFGMNNRMFFVFTISIVILFIITFLNFIKTKQNELTNIKIIQQISLLVSAFEELKEEINNENDRDDSSI